MRDGAPVADQAEERKLRLYCELEQRMEEQPVAVETLGGLGASTLKFLTELGSRISATNGTPALLPFCGSASPLLCSGATQHVYWSLPGGSCRLLSEKVP